MVRDLPGAIHATRDRADLGPGRDGRRGEADEREGLPRVHVLGEPGVHRLPEPAQRVVGPVLAACADEGTIVCFHIGSSSKLPVTSVEAPIDVTLTLMPVNIVQGAADIIWSGFLRKYPSLKVSL